jgi:hypothetical protein
MQLDTASAAVETAAQAGTTPQRKETEMNESAKRYALWRVGLDPDVAKFYAPECVEGRNTLVGEFSDKKEAIEAFERCPEGHHLSDRVGGGIIVKK